MGCEGAVPWVVRLRVGSRGVLGWGPMDRTGLSSSNAEFEKSSDAAYAKGRVVENLSDRITGAPSRLRRRRRRRRRGLVIYDLNG